MKIHHVNRSTEEKWVFDPVTGPAKRIISTPSVSAVDVISHDGKTYEVQPDGSFDVDEETGRFFARQPGWEMGPSPFPREDVKRYQPPRITRPARVEPERRPVGRPPKVRT